MRTMQPMKTFNEAIHDELTAHSILILNYISGLQKKYSKVVLSYNEPLIALLSSHFSKVKTKNLSTTQWKDFERKLKAMRREMFDSVRSGISPEVAKFRQKELWYLMGMFDELSPIIHKWKKPELKDIAPELIFGSTMSERFRIMESSDTRRMMLRIKSMFLSGISPSDIIRSIVGSAILNYAGSAVGQTASLLRTNIQTIISANAQSVLHEFSISNKDVVSKEVFVAVLDSKTTIQCADADGEVYDIYEGLFPPLHENCRSRRYPLINGQAFVEGRWFYVKDGKSYIKQYFNSSAEKQSWIEKYIGGTPNNYSYEEFLKRQTASFQDEVLGKTRGKLFRDGNLKLSNFIDSSGRTLTIEELYSKYSKSFITANLKKVS